MKQCTSKYLLGLTATPKRKDSLEVLLYQQCGPIRHEVRIGEGHSLAKSLNVVRRFLGSQKNLAKSRHIT